MRQFILLTYACFQTKPNFHVLPKLRWNFSQNFTHVSIKAILKDTMCPMLPLVTLYSTRTLNNQR